jgi:hypothetical protein
VSEPVELALDVHDASALIFSRKAWGQCDDLIGDWWVAWRLWLVPLGGNQSPVPAHQRARCHDPVCV